MTSATSPDVGRAEVYAAEIAAFEGTSYESVVDFARLQAVAHSVQSAAWWPAGPIAVRQARVDAGSSSTRARSGSTPVIRLAGPQMTFATLIHELAHALAGIQSGHGPVFRRAHLDLTRTVFGEVEMSWLEQAYSDAGLFVGERLWTEPPPADCQPIV